MQDIKRGRAGAAALVPIIIVGFTCAAQAETAAKPPSVLIFDQKLRNGEVTVEYAYLPTNGYVIVYGADKDGKAIREPLGHVELKAGDHRKFAIELHDRATSGRIHVGGALRRQGRQARLRSDCGRLDLERQAAPSRTALSLDKAVPRARNNIL